MPTRIHQAKVGAALLALICSVGCGQHTNTKYGTAQRAASWSSGAGATNPVPGIDEGSVSFVMLYAGPPEGVSFVVWSDLPGRFGGNGSASAGGSSPGASYEGDYRVKDGRRIEFRAKTADGKSGSITIAGVDYDFAKGSLFLVSTRANPPKVAQITFDLSGFPTDDAFKEFARSTPQVREFFERRNEENAQPK